MDRYSRNAKRKSDAVIAGANEVADKTLNKRANYHGLERELPENILLDHWRFINDRILRAEEAKIRMECTPELIGRMYRRFLPQTVGRRNGLIDCDLQDAYYADQYNTFFNQARDILLACSQQLMQEADQSLADLKKSL